MLDEDIDVLPDMLAPFDIDHPLNVGDDGSPLPHPTTGRGVSVMSGLYWYAAYRDPKVMGGRECFRGTEVSVELLEFALEHGERMEEFGARHPNVNRVDLEHVAAVWRRRRITVSIANERYSAKLEGDPDVRLGRASLVRRRSGLDGRRPALN